MGKASHAGCAYIAIEHFTKGYKTKTLLTRFKRRW